MAAKEAVADRPMHWPSTGEADWEALYASLEDGTYPAARPVYACAASDRLYRNPFMRSLTFELTGGWARGPYGYLGRYGLVQLDEAKRWTPDGRPPVPLRPESLSPTQEHSR